MKYLMMAMRPKQWIKNLFVLLPVVFGKKVFSQPENIHALYACFCFVGASSAVYLLNDILDLASDRKHPVKKTRPIASGQLSVVAAGSCSAVLAGASLAFAYWMSPALGGVVLVYLALNVAYSIFLKHRVIVDVFCIAAFFLLRLTAGSLAAGVVLSHWILFMTFLLALFLGFGKRRQELGQVAEASQQRKVLLQYEPYFIDQMMSVVTASIVIVYMLYTVDTQTVVHFGTKHLIYSIPFVYYGIFRYLYLIHKARIEGDPTTALFSDTRIQISLLGWIVTCVGVIYFGW